MSHQDKGPYASVILSTSGKSWTVAVVVNGLTQAFAVFRNEGKAQAFAESERRRLGLERTSSNDKA